MGVYSNGFGAAFTCQMKLWHMGRKMFCPAQAGQLVCVGDIVDAVGCEPWARVVL